MHGFIYITRPGDTPLLLAKQFNNNKNIQNEKYAKLIMECNSLDTVALRTVRSFLYAGKAIYIPVSEYTGVDRGRANLISETLRRNFSLHDTRMITKYQKRGGDVNMLFSSFILLAAITSITHKENGVTYTQEPPDKNTLFGSILESSREGSMRKVIINKISRKYHDSVEKLYSETKTLNSSADSYRNSYNTKIRADKQLANVDEIIQNLLANSSNSNDNLDGSFGELKDLKTKYLNKINESEKTMFFSDSKAKSLIDNLNHLAEETAAVIKKRLLNEAAEFDPFIKSRILRCNGIVSEFFYFPELMEVINAAPDKKLSKSAFGLTTYASAFSPSQINDVAEKWSKALKTTGDSKLIEKMFGGINENIINSYRPDTGTSQLFQILPANNWSANGLSDGYILSNVWLDIAAPGAKRKLDNELAMKTIKNYVQINTARKPDNSYEEFLVWYRQHKNRAYYKSELHPKEVLEDAHYHHYETETHTFKLEDPGWLKVTKGVAVGAFGEPQSFSGGPSIDDLDPTESIKPQTINPNTTFAKLNEAGYSALPSMIDRGVKAANSNMAIVIHWSKDNDRNYWWWAYLLSNEHQEDNGSQPKIIKSEAIAQVEIDMQYKYYNMNLLKSFYLPSPFSNQPIPNNLIY